MGIVSTLITTLVLAGPPVEVSTFSGKVYQGELNGLAQGQLTLMVDGEEKPLPLDDVLELRLETKAVPADHTASEVLLTDGSKLTCQEVLSTDKVISLEHATLGKLELDPEFVSSIRLAPASDKVADAWTKLTERRDNTDLLVIDKDGILDHIKGGVGPISDKSLSFFLGGKPNPIPRSNKLYGVVYGNRKLPSTLPICKVILPNQDIVELKSLTWTPEGMQGEMVAGAKVMLSADQILSLDFSLGKVQFLSDITPRRKKLELPFFLVNEPIPEIDQDYYSYKINKNFSGKPLQVGDTVYARGLCIHPKTELSYRLSKEMRRFQAVMGIDKFVANKGMGDVKVTIKGDDKTLLETTVTASDDPQKLDIDVSGVVVLEIIVDLAHDADLGVGDHLDLADAKFIK